MKTLVTGGTGFVGSVLVRQLLAQQVDVRILRRATSKLDLLGSVAGEVEHVIGDITDPTSLDVAMRNVDRVYHVAALVDMGGRRARHRLHRVNVHGTACVVNAALREGVRRLVHTSSIAAIGRRQGPVITLNENVVWQQSRLNTPYAVSKHKAEIEIHRGIAEGLDAVMVNPSLVFGPGRQGENTMQIVERLEAGSIPAVSPGGMNVVDVEDVASGHILAMERGQTGARYILGAENLTWKRIFATLAAALGVEPPQRQLAPKTFVALGALAESWAFLTGGSPVLTRTLARNLAQIVRFQNDRAVSELGCSFRPFADTAQRTAAALA